MGSPSPSPAIVAAPYSTAQHRGGDIISNSAEMSKPYTRLFLCYTRVLCAKRL